MASGTVFFIPPNGANIIQTAPGLPTVAFQASGAIPYPQYGAQQVAISTNAPQQAPQKGPLERFFKAEPKVLGAIQILIGLIHIGFGAVSLYLTIHPSFLSSFSGIGGYPFWGGIFFISSGSLCVAAANRPNHSLVKCSTGLNITSAIMSLIGIILYLCDLIDNSLSYRYIYSPYGDTSEYTNYYSPRAEWKLLNIGCGLAGVLLLFSLLEFCIAVSLAHLGCQATCCSDGQPTMVFMPYQVIGDGEVADESNPLRPPPTYDNIVPKPQ